MMQSAEDRLSNKLAEPGGSLPASNFRLWPNCEVPTESGNVCYLG